MKIIQILNNNVALVKEVKTKLLYLSKELVLKKSGTSNK